MEQALGLDAQTIIINKKPYALAPITIGMVIAIKREAARLENAGEDEDVRNIELAIFIAVRRLAHAGMTAETLYELSPAEIMAIGERMNADLNEAMGNRPAAA